MSTAQVSESDWIMSGEAAKLLDCSVRTVQRMAARGELPFVRQSTGTGSLYVFSRQVVELVAKGQKA